jgi:hypothetical protein
MLTDIQVLSYPHTGTNSINQADPEGRADIALTGEFQACLI